MEPQLKVPTLPSEQDERPLLKPEPDTPSPDSGQSIDDMEKKCAAYVRSDLYGPMGRGKLSWAERFWLVPRLVILVPIRVVAGMTVLVSYYVICRVFTAFRSPHRQDGEDQEDYADLRGWRRAVILHSGRFLSRVMLFVFGFYWISEASSFNEEAHMIDERSVSKLPLVGLISKCLGCVFVQRELKSSNFKGVSGLVTERIGEAYQNEFAPKMIIFPEGTTTNGAYLLPFKTGVFLAKAPVLPVIIRYPYKRFSPAWDSISGVRHVILLLSQLVNYIEVRRLPVYHPSEQEKDDPKLYASNVRKLMAQEGNLIVSDIGLADKRVYHAALNGLLSQR